MADAANTLGQRDKDKDRTSPAMTVAGTSAAAAGIGAGISGSGNPGPATGAGTSGSMTADERQTGYGAADRRGSHDESIAHATSVLGTSSHDEPDTLGQRAGTRRGPGDTLLTMMGGNGWTPKLVGAGLAWWGLRRGGVLGLAGMALGSTVFARAMGWTSKKS